ncbi:hypothetical protein LINGRAHAP2_LOCUS24161 [Linum grandiflorum]
MSEFLPSGDFRPPPLPTGFLNNLPLPTTVPAVPRKRSRSLSAVELAELERPLASPAAEPAPTANMAIASVNAAVLNLNQWFVASSEEISRLLVFEHNFSFLAIKKRLESLWALNGIIQVADMSNWCYVVRFSSEQDYLKAAFGGPWKIFDYYIVVSIWSPNFNVNQPIRKIITWIHPLHYFNDLAVSRIAGYVGRAI